MFSDLPFSLTMTELELMFRALTAVVLLNNEIAISWSDGTDCEELKTSSVVVMTDPGLE